MLKKLLVLAAVLVALSARAAQAPAMVSDDTSLEGDACSTALSPIQQWVVQASTGKTYRCTSGLLKQEDLPLCTTISGGCSNNLVCQNKVGSTITLYGCAGGSVVQVGGGGGGAAPVGSDGDVQLKAGANLINAPGFSASTVTGAVQTKILNGAAMVNKYATTGDGVSTCWSGWEASIAASGITNLRFPAGLYCWNTPLPITAPSSTDREPRLSILGDGVGATRILFNTAGALVLDGTGTSGAYGVTIGGFSAGLGSNLGYGNGIFELKTTVGIDFGNMLVYGGPQFPGTAPDFNSRTGYLLKLNASYHASVHDISGFGRKMYLAEIVDNPAFPTEADTIQFSNINWKGPISVIVRGFPRGTHNLLFTNFKYQTNIELGAVNQSGSDSNQNDVATLVSPTGVGDTALVLTTPSGVFQAGDPVLIDVGDKLELSHVNTVTDSTHISVSPALRFAHVAAAQVLHGGVGVGLTGNSRIVSFKSAFFEQCVNGIMVDETKELHIEDALSSCHRLVRAVGPGSTGLWGVVIKNVEMTFQTDPAGGFMPKTVAAISIASSADNVNVRDLQVDHLYVNSTAGPLGVTVVPFVNETGAERNIFTRNALTSAAQGSLRDQARFPIGTTGEMDGWYVAGIRKWALDATGQVNASGDTALHQKAWQLFGTVGGFERGMTLTNTFALGSVASTTTGFKQDTTLTGSNAVTTAPIEGSNSTVKLGASGVGGSTNSNTIGTASYVEARGSSTQGAGFTAGAEDSVQVYGTANFAAADGTLAICGTQSGGTGFFTTCTGTESLARVYPGGNGTIGTARGAFGKVQMDGSGSIAVGIGGEFQVSDTGAGSISTAVGAKASSGGAGTVANYGLQVVGATTAGALNASLWVGGSDDCDILTEGVTTGDNLYGCQKQGTLTAPRTYTWPDSTGEVCLNTGSGCGSGGGGGGLGTVREVDGNPSVSSVTVLETDQTSGLYVSDQGGGVARIFANDIPLVGIVDATSQSRILGRGSSGAGPYQELTPTGIITISGTNLVGTELNRLQTDGAFGIADNQVPMGTGANTVLYKAMPATGTNGCSGSGEALQYNTGTHTWSCLTGIAVGSGIGTVQVGDSDVVTSAATMDFLAADFNVTNSPAGEANVSIDYTNGQAADTATKGFLTAADWNTFNGKLGAEVDGSITNELEVEEQTYSAANFNGDASHGISQNQFYDLLHLNDADDDGRIDTIDSATAGFVKSNSSGVLSIDASTYLTAEVNNLEAQDPASILDDEVYVGDGAGSGTFVPLQNCVNGTESLDWNGTAFACNTIAAGTGDVTAVGDCTVGNCFTPSAVGTETTLKTNSDFIVELDNDANSTSSFQLKNGADATVMSVDETGIMTLAQQATGGDIRLFEGSGAGTNYVGFLAPNAITANGLCTLLDSATRTIPNGCLETLDLGDTNFTAAVPLVWTGNQIGVTANSIGRTLIDESTMSIQTSASSCTGFTCDAASDGEQCFQQSTDALYVCDGPAATWAVIAGGGGSSPGGADNDLQFRLSAGTFGGSDDVQVDTAANQLEIIPSGATGASVATGGAVLVENTLSNGAGIVAYTNNDGAGASTGRLITATCDHASFDEQCMHVEAHGVAPALDVRGTNANLTSNAAVMEVTGPIWSAATSVADGDNTAFGITSESLNLSAVKILHNHNVSAATDAGAAGLGVVMAGSTTAAQALFMDAPDNNTYAGPFIFTRRGSGASQVEVFKLTGAGDFVFQTANVGSTLTVTKAAISGGNKTATWPNLTGTVILDAPAQTLQSKTIDGGDAAAGTTRPAGSNIVQIRTHNTDCTTLTDGKAGEKCLDEDDNREWTCFPTAGDCSGTEWHQTGGIDGTAYDATAWNGSFLAPTKDAVRDKIETIGAASASYKPPKAAATRWFDQSTTGFFGVYKEAQGGSQDILYAVPLYVGYSTQFDRIGLWVSGTASGNLRMGVYSSGSDGMPGALINDCGLVSAGAGTNTTSECTFSSPVTLAAGNYWLAMDQSVGLSNKVYSSAESEALFGRATLEAGNSAGMVTRTTGLTCCGTALPDPFGAVTVSDANKSIVIGLRSSATP